MPHVFFAFGRRQKGESVLVSGDRNPFFFADSDCDSIGDNTFLSSFTQEEGYIAMGTRCITCLSESPERTRLLGELLSGFVEKALCILLRGNLGAGKTVFTRGLAKGLGFEAVRSPSFSLVLEYPTLPRLIHVDLYRIESGQEEDLALEEYIEDGNVLVIEWPERARSLPGTDRWFLDFIGSENPARRFLRWRAEGPRSDAVETLFLRKLEEEQWAYSLE